MIGTATSQNKTWFGHHLARTQHSPHTHTQIRYTHISPTFTCTLPTIYQVIRNRHDCNTLQYTVPYFTSPPTSCLLEVALLQRDRFKTTSLPFQSSAVQSNPVTSAGLWWVWVCNCGSWSSDPSFPSDLHTLYATPQTTPTLATRTDP